MHKAPKSLFAACLLCALAAGCASEVVRRSSELTAAVRQEPFVLSAPSRFTLDTGYSRDIAAGTEFVELGAIREGRVLKPVASTFTVEGAHMHEAYPVERESRLVGFYLPVERAFSPLSQPVEFKLQRRP